MKNNVLLSLLLLPIMMACDFNQKNGMTNDGLHPPIAEKKDSVLTIHGDTRIDPYFWMRLTDEQKSTETPDAQTTKVLDYLKAENTYTDEIMRDTKDLQETLYHEIVNRIPKDETTLPYFKSGYWYYTRYEEGNEYPIHCRKKETLGAVEEIMLDVNLLAKDLAYCHVTDLQVSPDNKTLAFGIDTVSRRRYEIQFKDLSTGKMLDDKIANTTGSGAWANDNANFFYTSKDEVTLLSNKIWRHRLGDASQPDKLIYEELDPSNYIDVRRSKSGKYIMIGSSNTLSVNYLILKADTPEGEFREFTPRQKKMRYELYHLDGKFFIQTDWDAPNFRLMEVDENNTHRSNWREVIAHRKDVFIESIDVFRNYIVISERSNALPQLCIYNQQNAEKHYLSFNDPAYVAFTTSSNVEIETNTLRYGYSSMTTPYSIYDYNMETQTTELKKTEEVVGGHNPKDYVSERVFVTAHDGAQIPMSIVYKKGYKKDGSAPLLIYGYGSYGNTINPWFSRSLLSLLDRGFCYAIAHVRGGQSLGRQWYEDGKLFKKKNTFLDFISCSDFLAEQNYTSYKHLYASGGSAGGLLMGAIANMAPEKYNGIIAAVPFVDVVSTMLDETIPLTTNEFGEWGNPKQKDYYEYMLSYSPYDQVERKDYPNILVTTGLFDSQVQYWEPAKWVAKLRDMKTDDNILLLHTNMEAGHGGASGRFGRYRETALDYAFILSLAGIKN